MIEELEQLPLAYTRFWIEDNQEEYTMHQATRARWAHKAQTHRWMLAAKLLEEEEQRCSGSRGGIALVSAEQDSQQG